MILCDIDHFKQVNDRLGHQAGDAVLRRVAAVLHGAVRTEDVFARYGGEEFAVIARGIDIAGARAFAERMRQLLENSAVTWQGARVPVTISLGIAHNRASGPFADAAGMVAAADAALYEAKRAGRNRSQLAGSPGRYRGVETELAVAPASIKAERRERTWERSTAPTAPAAIECEPSARFETHRN